MLQTLLQVLSHAYVIDTSSLPQVICGEPTEKHRNVESPAPVSKPVMELEIPPDSRAMLGNPKGPLVIPVLHKMGKGGTYGLNPRPWRGGLAHL